MDKYLRMCLPVAEFEERMTNWHPNIDDYMVESDGGADIGVTFRNITPHDDDELDDTFSDVVYSDIGTTLAETLYDELRESNKRLATAESLTGGMVAASIVDVPGASEVFYGGIVAYTERAKMDKLGVLDSTLGECGAVSGETAVEMASGLLSDDVSIAVSTTGLAGPGGGTADKPVGLVYIAVTDYDVTEVFEHRFYGDREEIRKQAKDYALFHVVQNLRNNAEIADEESDY